MRPVEDNDDLIFCDGARCNVAVHESCYGIQSIPDGKWLCDLCKLTPHVPIKARLCAICPNTQDGAFKIITSRVPQYATQSRFIHMSCAFWNDHTEFGDIDTFSDVSGIDRIPSAVFKQLICMFCGIKSGACIQCCFGSCLHAYHVTCGMRNGVKFEIRNPDPDAPIERLTFCKRHRHQSELIKHRNKKPTKKRSRTQLITSRKMSCGLCKKNSTLYLNKPHYGLQRAYALTKRVQAYRREHAIVAEESESDTEDECEKERKARREALDAKKNAVSPPQRTNPVRAKRGRSNDGFTQNTVMNGSHDDHDNDESNRDSHDNDDSTSAETNGQSHTNDHNGLVLDDNSDDEDDDFVTEKRRRANNDDTRAKSKKERSKTDKSDDADATESDEESAQPPTPRTTTSPQHNKTIVRRSKPPTNTTTTTKSATLIAASPSALLYNSTPSPATSVVSNDNDPHHTMATQIVGVFDRLHQILDGYEDRLIGGICGNYDRTLVADRQRSRYAQVNGSSNVSEQRTPNKLLLSTNTIRTVSYSPALSTPKPSVDGASLKYKPNSLNATDHHDNTLQSTSTLADMLKFIDTIVKEATPQSVHDNITLN